MRKQTESQFETLTIAHRFCGPPDSGNGGYVSGLLGKHFDTPAQVRLSRPPPMDKPLQLHRDEDRLQLLDADQLIAEGRPAQLELDAPQCPALSVVRASQPNYAGFRQHAFPDCFVCGPDREQDDGMRIFAAPIAEGLVAGLWTPPANLGDAEGSVAREYIWAALDCPGYFAVMAGAQLALLGTFTVRIEKPVLTGHQYVVAGWPAGNQGRKYFSGTAIYDDKGELLAIGHAVWITIAELP